MAKFGVKEIFVIFFSLTHFILTGAGPIHMRAPNPPLQQPQQVNQAAYHQQNVGINGQVNNNLVHGHPSQMNYNYDHTGYQERLQLQRPQNPSNGAQDSNHNYVKDDAHKNTQPIYRNQQNPQFQNYLYQKQNLQSRQRNPDPPSVSNNGNERSSQTYGHIQTEQICTSAGCRNRNDQVNNHQNQNAVHEMQQPQVQYITKNDNGRYKTENYVVEPNKKFLHPIPVGNNNGNNRAHILDARKARPMENNDLGQQRNIAPHRPHPNSFISPSAIATIPHTDTKNKGRGLNSGLVKIEYDFADKDVNDTYETTMELVADEL